MMRILIASVLLALLWCLPATADLCEKCRDLMYTDSAGKCVSCGAATSSAALKLCPHCSARLHRCEHCQAPLEGAARPAAPAAPTDAAASGPSPAEGTPIEQLPSAPGPGQPGGNVSPGPAPAVTPPPTAPGPIDPHKAGTYVFGPWKYRLDITDPDTRSEGRWGWLYYAGQRLPHGAVNDYYRTPWGSMYWVDVPQPRWGAHGWMTGPSPQNNRPGQALALPAALAAAARSAPPTPPTAAATPLAPQTAPAAAAGQAVEIGKADSGKRLRVTLGQPIVLRLPGNPTTGYRWQIAAAAGQAVRVVGDPTYSVPPAAAGRVGAGGSFTFRLQAAQQGSTTLKLFYVRPWEKGKPPADAFTVTLDVTGR